MNEKTFIVGQTYTLKGYPQCSVTYVGDGIGYGTDIYGVKSDTIMMVNREEWVLVGENSKEIMKEKFDVPASTMVDSAKGIRQFASGANRNSDEGKLDYEGFLSPAVLEAYAKYMHKNRKLEDGTLRDSDNWQKGIPKDAYMKSMWRHFMDVWKDQRGVETPEDRITNLCALMFNVSGLLFEELKEQNKDE